MQNECIMIKPVEKSHFSNVPNKTVQLEWTNCSMMVRLHDYIFMIWARVWRALLATQLRKLISASLVDTTCKIKSEMRDVLSADTDRREWDET